MDELTHKIVNDSDFQKLLENRSRLRWGMTALLVSAYALYGLSGVWFPEAMSERIPGTSMTWIMAIAYSIMFLAIVLSLFYVRIVGKMHDARGKVRRR